MADNEPDWPADPGPAEHADAPAASSGEDSSTGPAHPSWGRSVWADMLISGPGDSEHGDFGPDGFGPGDFGPGDSGPYGAGDPGWYDAGQQHAGGRPRGDAPSWPSSGLPPSFGQRPVAGERPDFEDAGLPPAGPAYGAHQPLTP